MKVVSGKSSSRKPLSTQDAASISNWPGSVGSTAQLVNPLSSGWMVAMLNWGYRTNEEGLKVMALGSLSWHVTSCTSVPNTYPDVAVELIASR